MHWMLKHSKKMDRPLRKALLDSHRYLRKMPYFLQKWLSPLHERASRHQVIIRIGEPLSDVSLKTVKKQYKAHGLSVLHVHPGINSFTAKVSAKGLKQLCENDKILKIHLDREVRTCLDVSTPSIGSSAAQAKGVTGKGITIAVIDTGIYPHPDLTTPVNRIIGFKDFVKNRTTPYDDNGHGTHVAGDAAGNGAQSGGKYKGPAPEANLVGVKVLSNSGSGSLSTVIAGIEWCVQNKGHYGIRIISMSLGSSASASYQDDPVCQAVQYAVSNGIVVVAAAGNEGPSDGTISSPGISPYAITVGAADTHRTVPQSDDTIADFSSRGPTIDGLAKPDIISPGVNITSLRSPGSYLDKSESAARQGTWYFTLSGTSMATPIVSGTIAQILQQSPDLSPDQVKSLLKENAVNLGAPPCEEGSGEVNVSFLAQTSGGTPSPNPVGQTSDGKIEWAFTTAGQHPDQVLINLFDSARSRLDIAIYSITHPPIAQAIAKAKQRGVDVRLITDKGESSNESQRNILNLLSNSGITIKEISHAGLMHLKISIIDETLVTTGSYNYSEAASTVNDDVLVVIRNPEISREWSKQFQQMWQQ